MLNPKLKRPPNVRASPRSVSSGPEVGGEDGRASGAERSVPLPPRRHPIVRRIGHGDTTLLHLQAPCPDSGAETSLPRNHCASPIAAPASVVDWQLLRLRTPEPHSVRARLGRPALERRDECGGDGVRREHRRARDRQRRRAERDVDERAGARAQGRAAVWTGVSALVVSAPRRCGARRRHASSGTSAGSELGETQR